LRLRRSAANPRRSRKSRPRRPCRGFWVRNEVTVPSFSPPPPAGGCGSALVRSALNVSASLSHALTSAEARGKVTTESPRQGGA
jgi:hypothetical protein